MREHLELVRKRFEKDNYAKSLGIVLDVLTEDTVQMHMQLREDMLNWFHRPHGGAIYSLADAAFSVLGNNNNHLAVALDCSITFHTSPDPGTMLMIDGQILSATRRTAAFLFKIYMTKGETRTLVATMKSVSYQTGKPIDPNCQP